MASLWQTLRKSHVDEKRNIGDGMMTLGQLSDAMFYQGNVYSLGGTKPFGQGGSEDLEHSFQAYSQQAYKANPILFAACMTRMLIFSEMRFSMQRVKDGRPGELFDDRSLRLLDTPWPNATTSELLGRAIQDTDLAGNHYVVREGDRLRRLRPDWVRIIMTERPEVATFDDVDGYLYRPSNTEDPNRWKYYPVDGTNGTIVHWTPIPDPEAQYRGMSWITPIIREIQTDQAATAHKNKYWANAATPNLSVSFKETVTAEQFNKFMEMFDAAHRGSSNAYKTLYLGGGADVKAVGANMDQMDFKNVQSISETRIAAAARVHTTLLGIGEGRTSLNEGIYKSAKDMLGDGVMRPLWRSICTAYEPLTSPVRNSRLWYDDRDISFLRADRAETSAMEAQQAQTIRTLVDGGFTPESAVLAVRLHDWSLLVHTGLFSVQLTPPGEGTMGPDGEPVDPADDDTKEPVDDDGDPAADKVDPAQPKGKPADNPKKK